MPTAAAATVKPSTPAAASSPAAGDSSALVQAALN